MDFFELSTKLSSVESTIEFLFETEMLNVSWRGVLNFLAVTEVDCVVLPSVVNISLSFMWHGV